MENLWPERFDEISAVSVKGLLEEQAKLLVSITKGIVAAEVVELGGIDAVSHFTENVDFAYRFNLVGKFLDNYKFTVLRFAHDITLYPVQFVIDDALQKELGIETYRVSAPNSESARGLIKQILNSDRVRQVVGAILRLSK